MGFSYNLRLLQKDCFRNPLSNIRRLRGTKHTARAYGSERKAEHGYSVTGVFGK